MGSAGSKAAQQGARKFPARAAGSIPPTSRPPPPRSQPAKGAYTKDDAIRADSVNPEGPSDFPSAAFADRLKRMGVADPAPTFSPSSTASMPLPDVSAHYPPSPQFPPAAKNATLGVLAARRQIQEKADAELEAMGRSNFPGREFLTIGMIRDILVLREQGASPSEIETRLGLKAGLVKRLGPMGIVSALPTARA